MSQNSVSSTVISAAFAVLGVLLGALIALLFYLGILPLASSVFIATAVVGLVLVAVLASMAGAVPGSRCLRRYLPLTLFAAVALLALSVLSLSVVLIPGVVALAVLVFLVASFLFIALFGTYALSLCLMSGC